jgi:hypothetical protein
LFDLLLEQVRGSGWVEKVCGERGREKERERREIESSLVGQI